MNIAETRKQVKFTVEALHQLLELPTDAVIRDIRFEDISNGVVTCYYVEPNGEEPTPEGAPSLIYTAQEKFHKHSYKSNENWKQIDPVTTFPY